MSQQKKSATKDLDKELGILRDLIEKENDMLRKMINSLDALEKKMMRSGKKEGRRRRKS
jgi:prefoldin subunit 5